MSPTVRIAPPGAAPGASYEQPFEMLEACHERVHRMLALLARLQAHVAAQGADAQARQAAQDVMRYFDQAAPQHHLDEERHVFPPLLAQGNAPVVAVVQRLQADHVQMEQGWQRCRLVLDALARGAIERLDGEAQRDLDAFAALYGEHIRAEEDIAYPQARQRLDAAGLDAMAQDMMRRRGLRP